VNQANATIDIKRILINYKKLSKTNISLAQTKSRLAELQALWKEVRYRHNDITFAATADRKELPYFVQEEYYAAEDAYKATDYLHEARANFVMPESSIYDLSTDSALCDFAGTLDTVTDNSRNEGRSLADRIPVQKCIYCTDSHGLEDCEKILLLSVAQYSY